jgi:hypothetical protein
MFCRFCGANILEDSFFCAKCGKRLGRARYPRVEKVVKKLRLKTPYPYFALLLTLLVIWMIGPRHAKTDYSHLKWSLELDKKITFADEKQFHQAFSLVVENTGTASIQDVPVELSAHIEPAKRAEVVAGFLGRRLVIMEAGKPLPLVVVLADPVPPGGKRRYLLDGAIQADPPFKVTYEVRQENAGALLASCSVEP